MCSIAGWYCFGKTRPTVNMAKGMLIAGRTRGVDAAGVAWRKPDGNISILKEKGDAKELIAKVPDDKWKEITQSRIGLLHNRKETKGSFFKRENNHPVDAFGWVVTHNGTITNDDDVFAYHKVERPAEVDTVSINMLLSRSDEYPRCFQELTVLNGGCTAAMWSLTHPENLGIVRLGLNELWMWWAKDILFWSSAPSSGQALPFASLGSLVFQNSSWFPDERLLVLTPEGAKTFVLKRNPFLPPRKVVGSSGSSTPSNTKIDSTVTPPSDGKPINKDTDGAQANDAGSRQRIRDVIPIEMYRDGDAKKQARTTFSWYAGDKATQKPPPIFENVKPPYWWDLQTLVKQTRNGGRAWTEVLSAYGTWHFRATPVQLIEGGVSNVVFREFHAAKRQKPFFSEVYKNAYPRLPIIRPPEGDTVAGMDDLTTLEHFVAHTFMPQTQGVFETDGYMCPVCGIAARQVEWIGWKGRCNFCNVRSRFPGKRA